MTRRYVGFLRLALVNRVSLFRGGGGGGGEGGGEDEGEGGRGGGGGGEEEEEEEEEGDDYDCIFLNLLLVSYER